MEKNIIVVEKNNKVAVYNKDVSNMIVISKKVYNEIKNAKTLDEMKQILMYKNFDNDYYNKLIDVFNNKNMFERYKYKNKIRKVNYAITKKCNLNCSHCCYMADYSNEKINIDYNIIENILKMSPEIIVITGGEPLLVDNILDILKYLSLQYDGHIALATNATLINEENISELVKLVDSFDISLDGINEDTTSKIRGKGVFSKTVKSIKLLKKFGASNITVSMVVDDNTIANSEKFNVLCESLGVKPVIRTMNVMGRARKSKLNDSDKIVCFMKGGINNIVGAYECPAGVHDIFVNSKGEVYPCGLFEEKIYRIGNIKDNDLLLKLNRDKELVWYKNFSEFISTSRQECSKCDVNYFCWSCPAVAKSFIENNNIDHFKNICADKKKNIMEAIFDEK